jgi:hypothetical protein
MRLTFKKEIIKKFLLDKQLLLNPRKIKGYNGIKTVFRCLKSLQYDPQNPCGRSIDLSLQARVSEIKPSDYQVWLYENREGIEVYDKELCVIPIEDLPLRGGRFSPARQNKLDYFIRNNQERLDLLLEYIKKKGPACSYDLTENNEKEKVDIFWEPTRWSKVALDSLWKVGKLVITCRKNGRKYFDIPENVYGNKFFWSTTEKNKIRKEQVKRRIVCVGLLPKSGTGGGWLGIGIGREIVPILKELISSNELIEINVEGSKVSYLINSEDLGLLKNANDVPFIKKISFLSPLDNLLWDRRLVKDIFDFDYKWEAYTPQKQRKHGHYVLPILYGLNFIGRIEPIYNQVKKCLKINGFWLEENQKWNKKIGGAFLDYLKEFKKYLNADTIEWSCEKPRID